MQSDLYRTQDIRNKGFRMIIQFQAPQTTVPEESLREKMNLDEQIQNISGIGIADISYIRYDEFQLERYGLYLFPEKATSSPKKLNTLLRHTNAKITFGKVTSYEANRVLPSHFQVGHFVRELRMPTQQTGELDIRIFPSEQWAKEAFIMPAYYFTIPLDKINKFGSLMAQLKCKK